jgi:hypothetical protein
MFRRRDGGDRKRSRSRSRWQLEKKKADGKKKTRDDAGRRATTPGDAGVSFARAY